MGVLRNEVPKWIAVFIWVSVQIGLFGYYFWLYYTDIRYEYTRRLLRIALAFARAPANCLNFNCMLILLPVCRNLISFTRRYLCKCCLRSFRRLLDENISFHKLCAYAICFWTTVHTIAHCYNVEQYVQAQTAAPDAAAGAADVTVYELSSLGSGSCPVSPSGSLWVNPVCEKDSQSVLEVLRIYPAISGVIITLALMIIVFSATEFIRRSYFEIFWFTHHIFVIFFAFLVSHGFRGVVRVQTNLDEHDPRNCSNVNFNSWGLPTPDQDCPFPVFESNTPSTWCWVLGPMVLYFIERMIRVYRSFQKVVITKVSSKLQLLKYLELNVTGDGCLENCRVFIECVLTKFKIEFCILLLVRA